MSVNIENVSHDTVSSFGSIDSESLAFTKWKVDALDTRIGPSFCMYVDRISSKVAHPNQPKPASQPASPVDALQVKRSSDDV